MIDLRAARDLLLVSPPLLWGQEDRKDIKPPLNLMYLASYLRAQGVGVAILDCLAERAGLEEVLRRVGDVQPRFLGVPLYQGTAATGFELLERVRERFPGITTVAGGPLVTTVPKILERCAALDCGVVGEGEITVGELLTRGLTAAAEIPGLVWRPSRSAPSPENVRVNQRREHLPDLDALPFLETDLVPMPYYYQFQTELGMPRWLFLTISRGCVFRCTYCATPALWPGHLRRCSVPRVLAELRHHLTRDPGVGFGFLDDVFFSDKAWLHQFCEEITPLRVRYCCIGRADHLEPSDVALLASSGCHYVALGVETGNAARQRAIRKFLDLDKVRRAVAALAEHHIETKCFFMLGFPDETLEEMVETIAFAVSLKRLGMHECNFFPVSVYPGTRLAEDVPAEAWEATVYPAYDHANRPVGAVKMEDIGEKRLSIYAGIPAAAVNRHLTRDQLLELVKLAYRKVETAAAVTIDEVRTHLHLP